MGMSFKQPAYCRIKQQVGKIKRYRSANLVDQGIWRFWQINRLADTSRANQAGKSKKEQLIADVHTRISFQVLKTMRKKEFVQKGRENFWRKFSFIHFKTNFLNTIGQLINLKFSGVLILNNLPKKIKLPYQCGYSGAI